MVVFDKPAYTTVDTFNGRVTKELLLFLLLVNTETKMYSRMQKSIENWSVCSKMAPGEVGVLLP